MTRPLWFLALAVTLSGCGASSLTPMSSPTTQSLGALTTRIVGTAQPPVVSSAVGGANVTGIAGALVDQLALNVQGPRVLSESRIAFASTRDGDNEIYTMKPDGSDVVQLTRNTANDTRPIWSPDGTKLAFVSLRDGGNVEIYTMNADGTEQTRISNNAALDSFPSWSPDGSKIVFATDRDAVNRDGNYEIYVMNADGSNQTRLTNLVARDSYPCWSPDGTKIAFASTRDGNNEIYTMNPDGTNQTRLTNSSAATDTAPWWSPDGTKIAYSSSQSGNEDIYVMNADGSSPVRITSQVATDSNPCWSPDGTRLIFDSARDGNTEVYTTGSTGGAATNLTKLFSASDTLPSWSTYGVRTSRTLLGPDGALGATAAGFLYSQKGGLPRAVVTFDTATPGSRAAARITSQSAPYNDQGSDLLFSLSTSAGLASVSYVNLNDAGVPSALISPPVPAGSTGAIVGFVASTGNVGVVLPYAANRSVSTRKTSGHRAIFTGNFTAVFDANGRNLAPNGARSVTLDENTGKLVQFE